MFALDIAMHASPLATGHARLHTRTGLGTARQAWLLQRSKRSAFRCYSAHEHPQQQEQQLQPDIKLQTSKRHTLAILAAAAATLTAAGSIRTLPAWAEEAVLSQDMAVQEPVKQLDTTVTHKVYLDVGICSSAFKPANERTLGDRSVLPDDAVPAGRIVIGLYGKLVPVTVNNFLTAIQTGSLTGTTFSRISPGEYIQAGRQGSKRLGEVEVPAGLQPNTELSEATAFKLPHSRPGTVSLSLSENDEDPKLKDRSGYRNTEFLITTGPGPVPRLDGVNVVFGKVLEGIDTVRTVSTVPSFQPNARSRQLNRFAAFIGDERADNVARKYGRPLKAVVITGAGVLEGGNSSDGR
eukprot:jgi/Chrzof1/12402/Cz06g33060.t1_CYP28